MWCARSGWGAVAEPFGVMKNAVDSRLSPGTVGVAAKCETRTTNSLPAGQRMPRRDHELLAVAAPGTRRAPSTVTPPIESPAKRSRTRLRWLALI